MKSIWLAVFCLGATITASFAGEDSMVTDSLSIGPRFHRETCYDEQGMVGENISYGRSLPLYKKYSKAEKIALPAPVPISRPLGESIEKRESIRNLSGKSINMKELSAILLAGDGITHQSDGHAMRAAPSGGALYPIETYLFAGRVDSITRGLYHFQVADSSLELINKGDFEKKLYNACLDQETILGAPITIVLTTRFARSTRKYADRGYRYIYMEAGAICQNIYLAATALGMGTVAVGAFEDGEVNRILEVDGMEESALLVMPIGYPKK